MITADNFTRVKLLKEEVFVFIKDFEGFYMISNYGRVFSLVVGRLLKLKTHNSGYKSICIYKNRKQKHFLIHRLVAESFINNPENKKCVGHKDTNKYNNHYSNLEWVTYSENNKNPITILKRNITGSKPMLGICGHKHPKSKTVIKESKKGILITEYGSAREAARMEQVANVSMYSVLSGKRKTLKGFIFKYKNNDN